MVQLYTPLKVLEAESSRDLYVEALEENPPTGDALPPLSISYSESMDPNPVNRPSFKNTYGFVTVVQALGFTDI